MDGGKDTQIKDCFWLISISTPRLSSAFCCSLLPTLPPKLNGLCIPKSFKTEFKSQSSLSCLENSLEKGSIFSVCPISRQNRYFMMKVGFELCFLDYCGHGEYTWPLHQTWCTSYLFSHIMLALLCSSPFNCTLNLTHPVY